MSGSPRRRPPQRALPLAAALAVSLSAAPALARFEVGFYDHGPERTCSLAQAGVSLVVMYLPPQADAKRVLDEAARCQVRLALQVETRLPADGEDLGRAAALVRGARLHPALAAWYAFDEPELKHPVGRVTKWTAQLRRLDPAHPLLVVHSGSERAHAFAGLGDLVGLDYYPVRNQAPLGRSLETVIPYAERLLAWTKSPRRPAYYVVQSFSWRDFPGCSDCRFPTGPELRYLAYSPIVSGVDGVIFWTRYRTTEAQWRTVVEPVVRELGSLRSSLDRTRAGRVLQLQGVRARALPDGLVIAVNDRPRSIATTRIAGPPGASHADVIGEGRRLPTIRGTVVDTFGPYGVHVYKFCGQRGNRCEPPPRRGPGGR